MSPHRPIREFPLVRDLRRRATAVAVLLCCIALFAPRATGVAAGTGSVGEQDLVVTFMDLDGLKVNPSPAVTRFRGVLTQPDAVVFGSRLFRQVSERKLLVEWTTKGQGVAPIEVLLPAPRPRQTVWLTLQTDKSGRLKAKRTKVSRKTRRAAVRRPRIGPAGLGARGAPPGNDDCVAAFPIGLGSTAFTTLEATLDGPAHPACLLNGQVFDDVWYVFDATASGLLTVSTCDQADFDTVLAAYDGTDCASLSFIDCNDDGTGCSGFTSELSFIVSVGQSYLIRVGGFDAGQTGSGALSLTLDTSVVPPPNDDCETPLAISCNSSITFDNTLALADPNDPATCALGGVSGAGTVWFEFIPDRRAALIETTRSDVEDTILALFLGSDCANLTLVGCSDDTDPEAGDFRSKISISNLIKGQSYRIMVSSFNATDLGEITLDITCPAPIGRCCLADGSCSNEIEVECDFEGGIWDPTTKCQWSPCPAPPSNATCDTAEWIPALPATAVFNNFLAVSDIVPGTECGVSTGPFDNVWYELLGTGNTITVTTCNPLTEIDTKIAVYCRDCADLVCVTGADDDAGCPFGPSATTVSFATEAGSRYLVTIGSWHPSEPTGTVQVDFLDDGVPAVGAVVCEPVGACCFGSGVCLVGTRQDCDDMGGDFLDEGTTCQLDILVDGGFELGPGGGAWIETSTNFGTPICDELCGDSGSPDPHFNGSFWAWFGGSPPGTPEVGTLEQSLYILATQSTTLEFQLEIPFASRNGVDLLRVLVDGIPVHTILESEQASFASYAPVRIDLSSFGDDAFHAIRFEGMVTGLDNAGLSTAPTNFFVDAVRLLVADNACR